MVELCGAYEKWLSTATQLPKLFINAEPGSILKGRQRERVRAFPNQTEIMVAGSHFIQEDSAQPIGEAVAKFVAQHAAKSARL